MHLQQQIQFTMDGDEINTTELVDIEFPRSAYSARAWQNVVYQISGSRIVIWRVQHKDLTLLDT